MCLLSVNDLPGAADDWSSCHRPNSLHCCHIMLDDLCVTSALVFGDGQLYWSASLN